MLSGSGRLPTYKPVLGNRLNMKSTKLNSAEDADCGHGSLLVGGEDNER